MADMGLRIDRRAAEIHADFARKYGLKGLFDFRQRVVDSDRVGSHGRAG